MPEPEQITKIIKALDALLNCGVIVLTVEPTDDDEGVTVSFGTNMPQDVAMRSLELFMKKEGKSDE